MSMIMSSLKSYLPVLAIYLNVSPDALYERQRTLIRSGLLVPIEGRGPGSGVKVSVVSVSLLILSTLATESLAEIDTAVRRLGQARAGKKSCPITGSIEFGQALEIALAQTNTARRISWIRVVRSTQSAEIVFASGRKISTFGESGGPQMFQMNIEAELPGFALWCIATDLSDIAAGRSAGAVEKRAQFMRTDPSERWILFSGK